MNDIQRAGRLTLLTYIALVLLINATTIGVYVHLRGTDRLSSQIIRISLTALLCLWLYRGSPAAKWILIGLLAFGGLYSLLLQLSDNLLVVAGGLVITLTYLSFAVALINSDRINAFLISQRGEDAEYNSTRRDRSLPPH